MPMTITTPTPTSQLGTREEGHAVQALSAGYIHGQTWATLELSPPSQRATTLSPRLDGCRTGDRQSGYHKTHLKVTELP